eukprot:COSAG04_NODE_5977_length_1442_cov_1.375279_2_plen_188_part_00
MALKCTRSHAPPGAQVGGGACGAAWLLKFSSEYASDDKPKTPSASEQQSAKSSSYSYPEPAGARRKAEVPWGLSHRSACRWRWPWPTSHRRAGPPRRLASRRRSAQRTPRRGTAVGSDRRSSANNHGHSQHSGGWRHRHEGRGGRGEAGLTSSPAVSCPLPHRGSAHGSIHQTMSSGGRGDGGVVPL